VCEQVCYLARIRPTAVYIISAHKPQVDKNVSSLPACEDCVAAGAQSRECGLLLLHGTRSGVPAT